MRRLTSQFHHYLLILVPALALSACGFVDSGGSEGVSIDPRNRIVNEQTRVVLDATALVDDPKDKTFVWSLVSDATVNLINANTARASFIAPGVEQRVVLIFGLTVTDPYGASTSDQVKITVNNTPIANAGADRSGRLSTRIALNGAGSTDTDGTITYLWQQTSGPPVASPDSFDTFQASFVVPVAPAGTVLSFRLIVTDNNGATASDMVNVTVTAPPPPPPSPPRPTPTPDPTPPPSPNPQPPITGPVPPDDGEDGDGVPPGPPPPPDDDGPAPPPDDGEDGGVPPGPPPPPDDDGPAPPPDDGEDGDGVPPGPPPPPDDDGPAPPPDDGEDGDGVPPGPPPPPDDDGPAPPPDDGEDGDGVPPGPPPPPDDDGPAPPPDGGEDGDGVPPGPPPSPNDDGPAPPPDDGEDGDGVPPGPPPPTSLDDDSSSVPSVQAPGSGTPSRTPGNGRPDANDDLGGLDENGEETDDGGEDNGGNILPLSATVASVVKKDSAGRASIVVGVLHNDSAFGGKLEPSTVTIVTPPLHGLASANPDGSVTYIPGSHAVDTFQYTVQDDRGRTSNVATVTILPRNADGDACWSAPRGQTVTGLLPAGASILNRPVLYRLVADAHNGTVAIVDPISGRFKYTPHAGASVDTFTYEVVNGAGAERHTATVVFGSRIMTLGGAITAGVIDARRQLPPPAQRIGYRQPLYELLTADGYAVDFVGSRSLGFDVEGFDADNEAHPGWTATELAYGKRGNGSDGIYGWLMAHPADIVLLQINSGQTDDGAAGVEAILKEIDRWEASPGGNPITVLLLAEVRAQASGESNIRTFNRGLETIVARRTADLINRPDAIVVIDDYRALVYPADFHDPRHPNRAGYRKMAQTWRDALVEHGLLSKCP